MREDTAKRRQALLDYDTALRTQFGTICGVDEAGRGPLAGDVYAAAVILPENHGIVGLDDSKKLSEKRRDALFDAIRLDLQVLLVVESVFHKRCREHGLQK